MRVTTRSILWSVLLLVAGGWRDSWAQAPAAGGGPTVQEASEETIPYEIQEGDTLRLIAVRYYGGPSAVRAIFEHNKAALKAKYEELPQSKRKLPFGEGTIYPGTPIELPAVLKSPRGRLYQRRGVPMTPELAQQIADKKRINLHDLENISVQLQAKPALRAVSPRREGHEASQGFQPVAVKDTAVDRGVIPGWYQNPTTDFHRCAVKVCNKYKSLCYFDCLTVARRFRDGMVECTSHLPDELPYEIDSSDKTRCSAGAP